MAFEDPKTCVDCGKTYYWMGRRIRCSDCHFKPRISAIERKKRYHQSVYMETAWIDFLNAHPHLVWWPNNKGTKMWERGPFGYLTGLDDLGGPDSPTAVGFFRPKNYSHVTCLFVPGTRSLRFKPRCFSKVTKRRKRKKSLEKWLLDTESCICPACLASEVLNRLAKEYYPDHIVDEPVNKARQHEEED
jgi:hypothetical protein